MTGDRTPEPPRPPAGSDDEEPVLPEVAQEDRDDAWGDDRDGGRRDGEWYRRQRPPHHE